MPYNIRNENEPIGHNAVHGTEMVFRRIDDVPLTFSRAGISIRSYRDQRLGGTYRDSD